MIGVFMLGSTSIPMQATISTTALVTKLMIHGAMISFGGASIYTGFVECPTEKAINEEPKDITQENNSLNQAINQSIDNPGQYTPHIETLKSELKTKHKAFMVHQWHNATNRVIMGTVVTLYSLYGLWDTYCWYRSDKKCVCNDNNSKK